MMNGSKKIIREAMSINEKLSNINNLLFIESNPCPVKYAAYLLGMCEYEIRLPLVKINKKMKKNKRRNRKLIFIIYLSNGCNCKKQKSFL